MSEKTLILASLNVRGLGVNSPKQKIIRTWLASLPSPPQILLIQEHHLGRDDTFSAGKGIEFWKGGSFWNPGIPMGRSQRTSAGTTILVDRRTAPLVVDSGILMEGRAQFIKLQFADSSSLTIVNVYAAQSSNNRALLWKAISRAEFVSDHTIIGGDFNHLEETTRKGTSGER
jgi:exonuclease III